MPSGTGGETTLSREIAEALADPDRLQRIVFSRPAPPETRRRVTVQPVRLRGALLFQVSSYDDARRVTVKNHAAEAAFDEVASLAPSGFRHVTILKSDVTLRLDAQAGGGMKRTRSAPEQTNVRADRGHDRKKSDLLDVENAREVLSVLGFLSHGGAVKPSMQKKLRQVNEFARILEDSAVVREADAGALTVVDCGCGNAYLTFSLFHFLSAVRKRAVELTGIDRDPDAVARNRGKAGTLGLSAAVRFVESPIADHAPVVAPDIVLSLHACDTASDDALAMAISWRARLVLCAPCCHHHLNRQLKANHDTVMTRSLSRHGILVEKMGDVLTDLFRVLILSIMGYRASTLKFVDPDNTERNTLIKAERVPGPSPSAAAAAQQYRELKAFWKVTPFLETALGSAFSETLDSLAPPGPPA